MEESFGLLEILKILLNNLIIFYLLSIKIFVVYFVMRFDKGLRIGSRFCIITLMSLMNKVDDISSCTLLSQISRPVEVH